MPLLLQLRQACPMLLWPLPPLRGAVIATRPLAPTPGCDQLTAPLLPRAPLCLPASPCSGHQVAVDVAEALVFLHTQLRARHGGVSSRWANHSLPSILALLRLFSHFFVPVQQMSNGSLPLAGCLNS